MATAFPTSAVLAPAQPMRQPRPIELFLLAFFLCGAALQQFPQMDENAWIRPVVTLFEAASFAMLLYVTPKTPELRKWLPVAVVLVIARFAYGWVIANEQYQTDIIGALQEGRFGIFIISAPVAYVFMKNMTVASIDRFVKYYIVFMILLDLYIYVAYVSTGALRLADRASDRFVLSTVTPLLAMWVKGLILQRQGKQPGPRDYAILAIFMLHIGLLTTSRSETVLLCSILAQWIYARAPNLRWPLIAAMSVVVYFVADSLLAQGQQVAGRDYSLAVHYAREAFPFGVGFVPEAAQKAQLGRASNFFTSDYGPLVLIYRYGLLGMAIAAGLFGFWLRFAIRSLDIPGAFLLALATLLYLLIVPVLDYGSLNGGILLGTMAAVAAVTAERRRTPDPDSTFAHDVRLA